ncbi:MAG: heavy-metal-associated domain-containing protein [Polaromonas sp.]|jgi:copper chaperone|uniref:heavy-metal-associated domain-containing protein n=1 Tax=Polaromonas sp. TaxID=1869339 RepID=UPI002719E2DB|nr:heavy-metal-associated domain-containing protein [Polaromonas sp.]MDO9188582.1 heavy-metal-associated domain-containing protein [Sulfurimicrobium sp.]MDO9114454.1 heavy-metal-associated domain-containing protein [Polaromonas sp.]MDP1704779.1 heavy-metal-associated domain-containing protein [Sulfurimicrobium sp.]MDP2196980.1 heavy-metal-associated domain-containing protein [Sulfurimicrobium sp.]MDP2961678.1 heavy-metal-associated domain-containing protein [Sulfurimicrobium sp.]
METITLTVKGMTCMGCVRSVKNVLEPIPGVSSVDITLENGQVTINYDAAKSGVEEFRNAVNDAGYDVVD